MSTVATIVVAGVSYCEYTRVSVVISVSSSICSMSMYLQSIAVASHNYTEAQLLLYVCIIYQQCITVYSTEYLAAYTQ